MSKIKYVLNPITGKFDAVTEFDTSKIITHDKNQLGNEMYFFDVQFNTYVPVGDLIVTDEEGNVVSI